MYAKAVLATIIAVATALVTALGTSPQQSLSNFGTKDWLTIVEFDGRGGVRKLSEAEEADFVTPAKGFALISGNSRAPEFKVWLKQQLGDFNADLITVPSTRSRCTVFEDKALAICEVSHGSAKPVRVFNH